MLRGLSTEKLQALTRQFGPAFYLLDSTVFKDNCQNLISAFRKYYPHFRIAYSYKTNYTPRLVQIINQIGGFAEVVSDMELEIALRSKVAPHQIIWNGPLKEAANVQKHLLAGGIVHLDSIYELPLLRNLSANYPNHLFQVGVRCNYDVGDGVVSRFGFDVESPEFDEVLRFIAHTPNVHLAGLQAHFAKRDVRYWPARTEGMLQVYDRVVSCYSLTPNYVDLGGGIYGPMPGSLRQQLGIAPVSYDDYAQRCAKLVAEHFQDKPEKPELLLEPGSAVAGNCMRFVCRVETIKTVRGKTFATVLGSQKNISMSGINPPMQVIPGGAPQTEYKDLDIVGFTCIEGDVLQKNYSGPLAVGDYIVLGNCGSYSVVMKPPFILPNFPVLDISSGEAEIIKRAENFEDLFHTFTF